MKTVGGRWEELVASAVAGEQHRIERGGGGTVDIVSLDGKHVIQCKSAIRGARDLHAALVQLTLYLGGHPEVDGMLIARFAKMSASRVEEEWMQVRAVIRPSIASRLTLIAATADGDVVAFPNEVAAAALAARLRRVLQEARVGSQPRDAKHTRGARWTRKGYEVWKVMLDAWLRCEPALSMQEIEHRAGASYPSVSRVVSQLERLGEVARTTSRSASFTALPRRSLNEILALGDSLRETQRFVDESGRLPVLDDLVERITARGRGKIGLGGVEAARFYMPTFDLNGTPRIDVTVLADDDLGWVKKVDPALAEIRHAVRGAPSPALVVHRLTRPESRFEKGENGRHYADRAETVLDLHELRLGAQADELVNALRAGGEL